MMAPLLIVLASVTASPGRGVIASLESVASSFCCSVANPGCVAAAIPARVVTATNSKSLALQWLFRVDGGMSFQNEAS